MDVKHKFFSVIFDGYPNPKELEADTLIDTIKKDHSSASQEMVQVNPEQRLTIHTPYREKKCDNCHNQNNIGQLKESMPGLCYHCHEDLHLKYGYLHGPVGGGYCGSCHSPHYSKNEKLLLQTGQELCLKCHKSVEVFSNKVHKGSDNHNCIDCHEAHGGDDKFIQKPGNCYKCHENFELKYKYLHGPVAGGYCMSCHGSHTMVEENLLIRQDQELCLYCHKKEVIFTTEIHKKDIHANCMKCHNAHGRNKKEF